MQKINSGPVILDLAGIELQQEEKEILCHPKVGGLIFFARNFENVEQLDGLVRTIRECRPSLVLTVDQEGGRVQRFRDGFSKLPPMQKLGLLYQREPDKGAGYAKELGWLMANELILHDIDLSFAPVLDVDDYQSDVIGDRSFSPDADAVSVVGAAFVDGMHEAGMCATAKHFPGHGGIKADSHVELPVDERILEDIETRDLKPFHELLPKVDALMSAHIQFPHIDQFPVSYSSFWLKDFLRDRLNFQGIVFSDDLTMAGAAVGGSFSQRAKAALNAGCDVVLVCNHREGAIEVIESLEKDSAYTKDSGLFSMAMKYRETKSNGIEKQENDKNKKRWEKALRINDELNELN